MKRNSKHKLTNRTIRTNDACDINGKQGNSPNTLYPLVRLSSSVEFAMLHVRDICLVMSWN